MAVLRLRYYGDPVLWRKVAQVESIDEEVLNLVEDMIATMRENEGVGLAAPQVGVSRSVAVVDLALFDETQEAVGLINLRIEDPEGAVLGEEGCLSIPGVRDEVERAERIRVRYLDIYGNEMTMDCEGVLARVLQHEYDHLQGVLFVDRLPTAKRSLLTARLKQIAKGELVT